MGVSLRPFTNFGFSCTHSVYFKISFLYVIYELRNKVLLLLLYKIKTNDQSFHSLVSYKIKNYRKTLISSNIEIWTNKVYPLELREHFSSEV